MSRSACWDGQRSGRRDRFERRDGVWKCLERTSRIDPNWPEDLFQPYIDLADKRFKAS